MFQTKVVEEIKTRFVFSDFFFLKIVPFVRSCGKNMVEPDRQTTDDNRAHAHCMLVT